MGVGVEEAGAKFLCHAGASGLWVWRWTLNA